MQASLAHWHLQQPLSREVVLADGDRLDVVGGLGGNGVTTSRVTSIDPALGRSRPSGPLARGSHDAGGALVAGQEMIFGGGSAASQPWIQRRSASGRWSVVGNLPASRSDLAAVTVAGNAYVIGGYDGNRLASTTLRVSPRGRVQVAGRLPVPVRYPAVTVRDGVIWVVGGQTGSGPTDLIQRLDVSTGRASIAGHLAEPLQGAAAVLLDGQIYVCGGVTGAAPTAQVLRLDPSTGHLARAGRLPLRVSYAGAAVLGNTGFLVGGETPAPTADVIVLRLVPSGASQQGARR